jgi:hypothetical protein
MDPKPPHPLDHYCCPLYVSSSAALYIGIIHLTIMVVLVKLPSNTMLHWLLPKHSTLLSILQHMSTIRQTLLKPRAYFPITQVRQPLAALRFSWLMLPASRLEHSPVKHFNNMTLYTSRQMFKDPHNTHTHNITSPVTTWLILLGIPPSQLGMIIQRLDNTSIPANLVIVPTPLNATHPRRGTPTDTIRMLPLHLPSSPLSFKVLIRTPFSSTKKKSTSAAVEPMLSIWLSSKNGPRCRLIAALTLLVLEPNFLGESSSVCRWGLGT